MHSKTEYLIWDKIVHSAKTRIDIASLGEKATNIPEEIMDTLILHIIAGFASGEEHDTISTNLHNELRHIGIDVQESTVDAIIEDKHQVFNAEIYATYLTFSMLESGHSEQEILGYVTELLDSPRTS